jgi:hypothetical protein
MIVSIIWVGNAYYTYILFSSSLSLRSQFHCHLQINQASGVVLCQAPNAAFNLQSNTAKPATILSSHNPRPLSLSHIHPASSQSINLPLPPFFSLYSSPPIISPHRACLWSSPSQHPLHHPHQAPPPKQPLIPMPPTLRMQINVFLPMPMTDPILIHILHQLVRSPCL